MHPLAGPSHRHHRWIGGAIQAHSAPINTPVTASPSAAMSDRAWPRPGAAAGRAGSEVSRRTPVFGHRCASNVGRVHLAVPRALCPPAVGTNLHDHPASAFRTESGRLQANWAAVGTTVPPNSPV